MAQKPSIPKGTRDFGPAEMARRNYIFNTISDVFRLYGFNQIETPSMEMLSTLMGKYGAEGDKLLFKILNSGDFLRPVTPADVEGDDAYIHLIPKISEKGLRYDLTVPFARFVVQHRNELQMPFRRFQIQPVWRADRPQKGRYREFYQCDADIVGSESLINEVELVKIIDTVFSRLGINIIIKLNNRKILTAIAELIEAPELITDITVAIDKIDKIGLEGVEAELLERGLSADALTKLRPILTMQGSNSERLSKLTEILSFSETGKKGIEELYSVLSMVNELGINAKIELDTSLARGLNYYTGTIIEVKAADVEIGSITGGGRYDNLTGVFGAPGLSGVGISFGADRIYDVMDRLNLYPESVTVTGPTVMFANLGNEEAMASLKMAMAMRSAGISAEVYPDSAKLKKQLQRADSMHTPYVAIVGEDELASEEPSLTLKCMADASQHRFTVQKAIDFILGK